MRRGEEGNGRPKKKAGGGLAAGGTGRKGEGQLPACAYHQISLMKWVKIVKPSEPGATDILSYAP